MRRAGVRLGVVLGVLVAHRAVGAWLVGVDPIAELLDGDRAWVGAALVLFALLRPLAWFVVVPWAVGAAVADAFDARTRAGQSPAQSSQVPRS